jgi:ligand-binding sensor domain-containing protein/signal transduction histidine kinase
MWVGELIKKALLPVCVLLLTVFCGPPAISAASGQSQINNPPGEFSARPNLHFDCLSAADGLSFSLSTAVLQDQRGFMWFGTRYGLDQYDGYNFKVVLPGPGGDLMGGNYILDVLQDRRGDLWMTTYIDLVHWDRKTGDFIHFKHDPSNPNSLTAGRVNTIWEDPAGIIWVGTNGGLNRYDPATERFSRFFQDRAVFRIVADRQGGIWMGTDGGLWYYDSGSFDQQHPQRYQNDPSDPNSLSHAEIFAIYQDQQGDLWVGSLGGGLNRLERASGKFTHYSHDPEDPYSLSNDWVYAILEDNLGRFWIGTRNGLNLLDRATGRFFQYSNQPGDPHSLSDDAINDLYQDRSGVLWVATLAGICKVNETASRFSVYQEASNQPGMQAVSELGSLPGLSDDLITAVYADKDGILWVGTAQGGLNRIDQSAGSVKVYQHDPVDPTSLSWGEVNAIYQDRQGTLWIGTSSGLDRFIPETGTFAAEQALQGQLSPAIVEDQQGNLWVGAFSGLMHRAAGSSIFAPAQLGGDLPAGDRVQELHVDRRGALWISTQNDGLFRQDPALADGPTPALLHFPQDARDPSSPGASPVMSFYEDRDGVLWMGTVKDGLTRYDWDTQTFAHFRPEAGIASYVSCVQGDTRGYLWLGTALGLARFDPRSGSFSYFDARDGLEVGEGIACTQTGQGEMIFGSWSGLIAFFPDQIWDNPKPPEVVITALNLRNQPLRTDFLADEQVELSYWENYLSFDFAALDYTSPAKNQYAYKMEGLDTGWIEADTRRHADYPDLKPGEYIFRVKASNNSGVWNEQGAAVRIAIRPPFWQTGWFLGLMGLALLGIIAGGVRLRLKSVLARSRDLERQVSERTGALEQKTQELEQRNLEIERRRQELEALLLENARLYEKSQELAVLEERSRLARELHDAVTQTLFSASLVAEALPATWEKDAQEGRSLLQTLRSLSRGALAEMRSLLLELRPAALLETPMEDLLRQLGEAASGRAGIPVTVQVEGQAGAGTPQLPPDVHIAFYRIAQEALNNVVKHARAHQATLRLSYTGPGPSAILPGAEGAEPVEPGLSLLLAIHDDGRGFDPAHLPLDRLGLGIMQERAQAIGAALTIESQPGRGAKVSVFWKQAR